MRCRAYNVHCTLRPARSLNLPRRPVYIGVLQLASARFVTSSSRSDCYRLERQLPGGVRTRKDTAPFTAHDQDRPRSPGDYGIQIGRISACSTSSTTAAICSGLVTPTTCRLCAPALINRVAASLPWRARPPWVRRACNATITIGPYVGAIGPRPTTPFKLRLRPRAQHAPTHPALQLSSGILTR